jgi:hypothetical protein
MSPDPATGGGGARLRDARMPPPVRGRATQLAPRNSPTSVAFGSAPPTRAASPSVPTGTKIHLPVTLSAWGQGVVATLLLSGGFNSRSLRASAGASGSGMGEDLLGLAPPRRRRPARQPIRPSGSGPAAEDRCRLTRPWPARLSGWRDDGDGMGPRLGTRVRSRTRPSPRHPTSTTSLTGWDTASTGAAAVIIPASAPVNGSRACAPPRQSRQPHTAQEPRGLGLGGAKSANSADFAPPSRAPGSPGAGEADGAATSRTRPETPEPARTGLRRRGPRRR